MVKVSLYSISTAAYAAHPTTRWRVVIDHADGRRTFSEYATRGEARRAAAKLKKRKVMA